MTRIKQFIHVIYDLKSLQLWTASWARRASLAPLDGGREQGAAPRRRSPTPQRGLQFPRKEWIVRTLWEKARMGWSERTALKQVYYQGWNRSPVQVGCMRQVLGGWCTGKTQRDGMGREVGGGQGWGTHVNPWLIHVSVWQNHYNIVK